MADAREPNENPRATVLLVEDDRPLLEFFSAVLRRDGYKVLEAGNGVEALKISDGLSDDRIDILFSDVAMPYMDGIQLALRLRETRPEIQVLLTTGLPLEFVIERCGPTFNAVFLPKPFTVSDLSGKVRQLAEAV